MNILEKIGPSQKKHLGFILLFLVVCFFGAKKISAYHKGKIRFIMNRIEDTKKRNEIIENISLIRERLDKFKVLSWDTNETVDIMGRINAIAGKHEIQIISFDPGGMKSNKNAYKALRMSLDIKGEYFNFIRLIHDFNI